MEIKVWNEKLKAAIIDQLISLENSNPIKIIDLGIFPWHAYIELSACFEGEGSGNSFYEDVASWPHYNFTKIQEGQWPDAEELANVMLIDFENGKSTEIYFREAAKVMKSEEVQAVLSNMNLSSDFTINLKHPDNPRKNYI